MQPFVATRMPDDPDITVGEQDVDAVRRRGPLVADLVDGRSSDADIPESDVRPSRFADGALLTTRFPYVGAGERR